MWTCGFRPLKKPFRQPPSSARTLSRCHRAERDAGADQSIAGGSRRANAHWRFRKAGGRLTCQSVCLRTQRESRVYASPGSNRSVRRTRSGAAKREVLLHQSRTVERRCRAHDRRERRQRAGGSRPGRRRARAGQRRDSRRCGSIAGVDGRAATRRTHAEGLLPRHAPRRSSRWNRDADGRRRRAVVARAGAACLRGRATACRARHAGARRRSRAVSRLDPAVGLWTLAERFDERGFVAAFIEHTRKNVIAAGQRWQNSYQQEARALAIERWRAVQRVLSEAQPK